MISWHISCFWGEVIYFSCLRNHHHPDASTRHVLYTPLAITCATGCPVNTGHCHACISEDLAQEATHAAQPLSSLFPDAIVIMRMWFEASSQKDTSCHHLYRRMTCSLQPPHTAQPCGQTCVCPLPRQRMPTSEVLSR